MTTLHTGQELADLLNSNARRFAVLSAPMRLHIISCLCHGEKNVSELLGEIPTTQPNLSQHLNTLYMAGFVSKRRQGSQIFYAIANERIVQICRLMCGTM